MTHSIKNKSLNDVTNLDLSANRTITHRDHLFVYGTLCRRHAHPMHQVLAQYSIYAGTAVFQGTLYDVNLYPGAVASSLTMDTIKGELYMFNSRSPLLSILDQYEECDSTFEAPTLFKRQRHNVLRHDNTVQETWIYIYNHPVDGLLRIQNGQY